MTSEVLERCSFCDGTEKPVEAGVCCDARFRIEYAPLDGFIMNVLDENDKWRCSLMVPHCPMCGRKREGDELNARAERTCKCIAEYAESPIDGKTIVLHRCSACHELMRPHMRYCPNCGARVIGTEAGE